MSTVQREITLRNEDTETNTFYKVTYQSTADIISIEQVPVDRPDIAVKMYINSIDCAIVFDLINDVLGTKNKSL